MGQGLHEKGLRCTAPTGLLPGSPGVTLGQQDTVGRGPSRDADQVGNQRRVENVAAWLGLCFLL